MTTSTTRVLALLEILQGGGTLTVPDLAARLGVDERTVRRYAGHLLDLGVPVYSVRGRYGGYRLAPGYRMPPLMLTEDEALAVLLGLLAAQRAGLVTTSAAASESAAAKLRRVLPKALGRRLAALPATADFTARPRPAAAPEAGVLLGLAEAALHQRPVAITYTDRKGRGSERTVLPYGLVAHSGRWYLTGADPAAGEGEVRTFRLDRITAATVRPGSFTVPPAFDPVTTVLDSLAQTPWTHTVSLRVHDSVQHLRRHLPADIATLSTIPVTTAPDGTDPAETDPADADQAAVGRAHPGSPSRPAPADEPTGWVRVRIRAERLDWIPPVLAALDRPFVIEHPAELRTLVQELAHRLGAHAAAGQERPPGPEAG
ncbi:Predicted DNA-binding transcriptional regulator YafY, contains an HTH and WYL domains [Streptomyces sp. 2224.1]|uniref:helix-turn-helix transcriptional regulator n=1 Tax=unclassified Streptomyces TaxID=2593676 RepID=UPI00088A6CCE|nr:MULTISPECIES: WYL domain-containing protein [unclassified Streptomyces]PBC85772.1 putative DNA-binding transcriptional regulator YafY [Streptomyces sp. 2321.6]SDR06405.1 Predicted DNA-binding transcriptional regulator YafY, contains an HTH and WYL domains [Streptomyces sp. KS_16]SED78628.1 Predicted DNA-binding transcriptional regulator YafY, contains an HTH and WYL domains [Streptomyces sp. 2133.1]SEE20766.1 Predicted DNA-binding transcriptional regulator YafY, contains an HTH and WYL domai